MSLEDGPLSLSASDGTLPAPETRIDPEVLVAQSGWLRAVTRNLVRDPWGAEDVAQEALLAALASPPRSVPDDSHLRAWLGRVAFNLSRLDLRSGGRRRARERVVARAESLPSAADELEARAVRSELMTALRALEAPHREVLMLRYFDGLATDEIARKLGISELAVRKRLWRAREKLRQALEPRPRPRLAALLPFGAWRALRLEVAGVAAASLAVLCAVWHANDTRVELGVAQELEPGHGRAPLALPGSGGADQPGERTQRRRLEGRTPLVPPPAPGTSLPPSAVPPEPRVALDGQVLDLEGRAVAGLEVVNADEPGTALATSDALGGFHLDLGRAPDALVVRAGAWATVVPGRFAPGAHETLLFVAPAAPLSVAVVAADGTLLPEARVELVAEDAAFTHVARAVTLPREVVQVLERRGDEFLSAALPRARGLVLRVLAPGYRSERRASLALGAHLELRLVPEGDDAPELTGTVSLLDGRPARGARVRLGRGETHTDAQGGFRLRLAGVEPDSALVVEDEGHAAHLERRFGQRLAEGRIGRSFEVVLDRPLDVVHGRVTGLDGATGWRVVAFPEADGSEPGEVPVADTGEFELVVPRGACVLYALAPDVAASTRLALADSRVGTCELAVRSEPARQEHVGLRDDLGRPLAEAQVELSLLLDGGRQARWATLTSDAAGALSFTRGLTAEVTLSVRHVALGPVPRSLAAGSDELLARASTLAITSAPAGFESFRVRNAAGESLPLPGPLGVELVGSLHEGSSSTRFLPPEARWLELLGPSGELQRVPLALHPGEPLVVAP